MRQPKFEKLASEALPFPAPKVYGPKSLLLLWQYVATASADNIARLWEVASGREVRCIVHPNVCAVSLSPDGKLIATADDQLGGVRLWEAATGHEVRRIDQDMSQGKIAFSPDGRYLARGNAVGSAWLWEVGNSRETIPLVHSIGHQLLNHVWTVAFSPDGKYYIATGAEGPYVRVWELATRREVARLSPEASKVWAVAFSPDGKYLAAGGFGNAALIWVSRHYPDLIEEVCTRPTRKLTEAEWNLFVDSDIPYRRTCPNLPPGEGAPLDAQNPTP